jgi:hypothetical protein
MAPLPAGGRPVPIHPLENWTCRTTVEYRPTTYSNPAPYHQWRVGQRLSDWLSNVVYWKLYLPQGAPIKINPALPLHRQWIEPWKRINRCVRGRMKRLGMRDDIRRPR